MSKRRFIKDPVWGNIEIFEWEKEILNHFLLNRLHNVIQNSTAFRVYPGLRHSRFSHSIGVMHAASQMFVNLVVNSDEASLLRLRTEYDIADAALARFGSEAGDLIAESVGHVLACPKEWALLLAAIRCAAVLHDIGHLPYSHVFEAALERFLSLPLPQGTAGNVSDFQKRIQRLLSRGSAGQGTIAGESRGEKLHEQLGRMFIVVLADDLSNRWARGGHGQDHTFGQAAALTKVANIILHDTRMQISKSLISGVLDADRIDYVRRDSFFSGLLSSSVDYSRLFSTYELAPKVGADGVTTLLPRPSQRSSSEAEKLLLERFQDYKYIASHHKVHLFDELLERLIYQSILDGSFSPFMKSMEELLSLVPAQIGETVFEQGRIAALKQQLLTEYDDAWLEQMIRQGYLKSGPNEGAKRFLFVSHIEARGLFTSLFKRDEDYEAFCGKYGLHVETLSVAARIHIKKYDWEDEIMARWRIENSSQQLWVVVGDTFGKISDGFGQDKTAADFFSLPELRSFLELKVESTTPFNAWYTNATSTGQEASEGSTREWVEKALAEKIKTVTMPK